MNHSIKPLLIALIVLTSNVQAGSPVPAETPPKIAVAKVCASETIDKNIYYCYRSFWPELDMTRTFAKMGINTRAFFCGQLHQFHRL